MLTFRNFALLGALAVPLAASAFTFTPDSYYASTRTGINQYAADGTLLDSLTPQSATSEYAGLRGIAFGGDGLLYVVRSNDYWTPGADPSLATIEAIDATGRVDHSYAFSSFLGGNARSGAIAFSNSGDTFYVAGGSGVYTFDAHGQVGPPMITDDTVNDLAVMPNGDLLVAMNYELRRYTSSGSLVWSLTDDIADPQQLTLAYNQGPGDHAVPLSDTTGIAYDANTNTIFVSMLGGSSGPAFKVDLRYKVMAIDGTTGDLKAITTYTGVNDLYLTSQGTLLIGSSQQAPASTDVDLSALTSFRGAPALFVTAMPVPEAASAWMWVIDLMGLIGLLQLSARPSMKIPCASKTSASA